jgi:hypothetical protein
MVDVAVLIRINSSKCRNKRNFQRFIPVKAGTTGICLLTLNMDCCRSLINRNLQVSRTSIKKGEGL